MPRRIAVDGNVEALQSLRQQDGSEVKSTELERLVAEGMTLTERRNCMDTVSYTHLTLPTSDLV